MDGLGYSWPVMENYLYVVAQNSTPVAPKKEDKIEGKPLFTTTSWILMIALVGLVIFYVVMKKKGKI